MGEERENSAGARLRYQLLISKMAETWRRRLVNEFGHDFFLRQI